MTSNVDMLPTTVASSLTAPTPPPRRVKPSVNSRVAYNYYGSPEKVKPLISKYNGKIGNFGDICDQEELTSDEIDLADGNNSNDDDGLSIADDDSMDGSVNNHGPTIDEILENEVPESIVGEGVDIHGELQFDRLLRIDGKFTGKLLSLGNVFVGETGFYKGDITHLENVVVSGGLINGNVAAEYVCVKNGGSINGSVTCKHLRVIGNDNTIIGKVNINPLAPEMIDENGDLIINGDEVIIIKSNSIIS